VLCIDAGDGLETTSTLKMLDHGMGPVAVKPGGDFRQKELEMKNQWGKWYLKLANQLRRK
jgi:hypothetical protein